MEASHVLSRFVRPCRPTTARHTTGQNQGVPLLVLELCDLGDVKSYFRKQGALPIEDLPPMCKDVACGMAFLETALIVHRDLAARNVLLTAERRCKIADFGLSRNTGGKDYYRRNAASAPIPVRWMAPETLTHDISTLSSDRWSFGVVLWEMYTFGERPYAGQQNKEVRGRHLNRKVLTAMGVCLGHAGFTTPTPRVGSRWVRRSERDRVFFWGGAPPVHAIRTGLSFDRS